MALPELLRTPVPRRAAVLGAASGALVLAAADPADGAGRPVLGVLGDSWAAGLHADPTEALGQVAAARLGWTAAVDAVSGTGYLNGSSSGIDYPTRASSDPVDAAAAIVVLQGGSNDDGFDHADIPDAVVETVGSMRARLPSARLLMLGPGPDPAPVTAQQTDVDRVLQRSAAQLAVPYVSPLQQGWFDGDFASMIDPVNHHPTVQGQQYIGGLLAAAVRLRFPDLTGGLRRRPAR